MPTDRTADRPMTRTQTRTEQARTQIVTPEPERGLREKRSIALFKKPTHKKNNS